MAGMLDGDRMIAEAAENGDALVVDVAHADGAESEAPVVEKRVVPSEHFKDMSAEHARMRVDIEARTRALVAAMRACQEAEARLVQAEDDGYQDAKNRVENAKDAMNREHEILKELQSNPPGIALAAFQWFIGRSYASTVAKQKEVLRAALAHLDEVLEVDRVNIAGYVAASNLLALARNVQARLPSKADIDAMREAADLLIRDAANIKRHLMASTEEMTRTEVRALATKLDAETWDQKHPPASAEAMRAGGDAEQPAASYGMGGGMR